MVADAVAAVSGIAHDDNPAVVAKLLRTAAGRIDPNVMLHL